jgi:hypothetical protein
MQTDGNYLYQRAEQELEMAARANAPEAVKAHYTLANLYLDRFYGLGSDRRRPEIKAAD